VYIPIASGIDLTKDMREAMNFAQYVLSFITISIGAFVAFIGYQQFQVNREKFKLDLFEKRFAVYKGVQVFLSYVMRDAKVDLEKFYEFRASTQDAIFLFADDVQKFLQSIDKKALELHRRQAELEHKPVGEARSRLCAEESKALEDLIGQLPKLSKVFAPYLTFKTWN
jgi:hypothetical protein